MPVSFSKREMPISFSMKEMPVSFSVHISVRVFPNISGGGGCGVLTGKSGKPR